MRDLTRGGARTIIEAAEAREIARLARPDDPDLIERGEIESALGDSSLVLDGLRRRPRWFDGRFLTGADLTRDQDYTRQRQSDVARASGTGVVEGLEVAASGDARGAAILIAPGHGLTPSGDPVIVDRLRQIALLDLADSRRLNAVLGLRLEPRAPLGRRTGLFVLGLRPVEFTANAIGAYPREIAGVRQVDDGDIVEATAITLTPWRDGLVGGLDEARRRAARDLFLGAAEGTAQDILPLAMLALDRGALRWIDMALVRRETGADTPLQVSLGARPRALAEAFALQHRDHLRDVLAERRAAGLSDAFPATQSFAALPPAGPLPAAAVRPGPDGFRQIWFPPEVAVTLGFAPEDEIASMIDESLTLPPMDLTGEGGSLSGIEVAVLAPVSRARLARFEAALATLTVRATPPPELAILRPADALAAMLGRRARRLDPPARVSGILTEEEAAELRTWTAAWTEAVAALPAGDDLPPLLWHVRRRSVPREGVLAGVAVPISGDDAAHEEAVRRRADELGLTDRLRGIGERGTTAAVARMTAFLGAPALLGQPALMAEAVRTLELALPEADPAERLGVEPEELGAVLDRLRRTSDRDALRRIERIDPALSLLSTRAAPTLLARGDLIDRSGLVRLTAVRAGEAVRPDANEARADPTTRRLSEADVLDAVAAFDVADLGDGLARLDAARGGAMETAAALWLGDRRRALEVDRIGLRLGGAAAEAFAGALAEAADARDEDRLAALIADAV
jgi:hypothetical protein